MMTQKSNKEAGEVDLGRRQALKHISRLAAYTPPAMLTLMVSKKAPAGSPVVAPPDEDENVG